MYSAFFLTVYFIFLIVCIVHFFVINKNLNKMNFLLSFIITTFLFSALSITSLRLMYFAESNPDILGKLFNNIIMIFSVAFIAPPTFLTALAVFLIYDKLVFGIIFCGIYYFMFIAVNKLSYEAAYVSAEKSTHGGIYKIIISLVNKLIRLPLLKSIKGDKRSMIHGITMGLFINFTTNAVPILIIFCKLQFY